MRFGHVAGLGSLLNASAAGVTRVCVGLARSTATTFNIFFRLQVTVNLDDVSFLHSAPNRPDYINVLGLCLHRYFLRSNVRLKIAA